MCSAIGIKSINNIQYFGRTMDFSFEIDPEIYIVPKNHKWLSSLNNNEITNKYKIIGIGQNVDGIKLVDGVNNCGLSIAALYFQGYAYFNDISDNKLIIPAIDLVLYLLGNCSNVVDVIKLLKKVTIVGTKDSVTGVVAPLHWIATDKSGKCITIEQTKKGLKIYNNPLQVLTNSPEFPWHLTNLRNYSNLSNNDLNSTNWNKLTLEPFGRGSNTLSLPGDFTSPSRFVRASFLKSFAKMPDNEEETINLCFNLMKSVFIPKGIIKTNNNTYDYTHYTAFINLSDSTYYFNTQNNNQIKTVNINDVNHNEIYSLGKL